MFNPNPSLDTTMASVYLTIMWCMFGRCGGSGVHGQRGAVGGVDNVHRAGADVGRLSVLPAAVGFQPSGSVSARRRRRNRRRGRRIQPAPPAPPAPPSTPP